MQPQIPSRSALFLDLDGTLIDIAPTPDGIQIPDGLVELLQALTDELGGALAIMTGRPIADVDRFLAPFAPVAAGNHGAELRRRRNGHIEVRADPVARSVADAVRRLADGRPGVIVEEKPATIAVHYRLAPDTAGALEADLKHILEGGPSHLILSRGRKVLEIAPRHITKGAALETLLMLPEFRGRWPVMIGDGPSDESAFAAAARNGGLGLKVAGEHFNQAEADFSDPAEVRAWLARLCRRDREQEAAPAPSELASDQ